MLQIYSGNLAIGDPVTTNNFQPSQSFVMNGERVSLDFEIIMGANAGKILFWLEFASTPAGPWYREVAEEDNGGGDVQMPFVVRTLTQYNGADLQANQTRYFSTQFLRAHLLARIQIAATVNGVVAHVRTISGLQALAPTFAPVPTLQPAFQPYLP